MATAIADVLEHGGTLMVEAGTGTGKTLAYLVPALAAGRRVIVSTGTRNLQDQIYQQELPFLRERLGLRFSARMMKGRDNYLCRYRLAEFEREPLLQDLAERDWVGRIAAWSRETTSGDRAEIPDLPDDLKMWRDVNARSDTCSGSRCPEFDNCWLTLLKRSAQRAQVVVVNHHLFFADLALRSAFGAVLPDYDTVIFDEAHLVEEVATLYLGLRASSGQVEELAREAERLAARAGNPARGGGGSSQLRIAAAEFFLPLRDRLHGEPGRVRFDPGERGGPDLEGEWAVLSEALDEVARQAVHNDRPPDSVESLPRRAEELRETLARVLERDDPAFVYGIELRGRASVTLSAAPIDVSAPLREMLFGGLHASVLTSATLTVEGEFEFFASRLGLDEASCLIVDTPFDHAAQAALYLPSSLPEPGHPAFIERAVEQIVELVDITDGRAFLLFTSYAHMDRVCAALTELDRWPLFVQGQGSKVALVESFRNTPRALLLGTTSFWHGVDVAGEALSMVVVDKLPFDVPSDPLVAARIERIRSQQGNPFADYQLPLAVLELKQGLGRLLRSKTDRGLLCVLDPRLSTRAYGKRFLRSLPPYQIVREIDAAAEFFRRN